MSQRKGSWGRSGLSLQIGKLNGSLIYGLMMTSGEHVRNWSLKWGALAKQEWQSSRGFIVKSWTKGSPVNGASVKVFFFFWINPKLDLLKEGVEKKHKQTNWKERQKLAPESIRGSKGWSWEYWILTWSPIFLQNLLLISWQYATGHLNFSLLFEIYGLVNRVTVFRLILFLFGHQRGLRTPTPFVETFEPKIGARIWRSKPLKRGIHGTQQSSKVGMWETGAST